MWSYLINRIELYSNHKSFSLHVDTIRNLWLLLHFKDLEIENKTIYYQVDNGVRQRKSTKHPGIVVYRNGKQTYSMTQSALTRMLRKMR